MRNLNWERGPASCLVVLLCVPHSKWLRSNRKAAKPEVKALLDSVCAEDLLPHGFAHPGYLHPGSPSEPFSVAHPKRSVM